MLKLFFWQGQKESTGTGKEEGRTGCTRRKWRKTLNDKIMARAAFSQRRGIGDGVGEGRFLKRHLTFRINDFVCESNPCVLPFHLLANPVIKLRRTKKMFSQSCCSTSVCAHLARWSCTRVFFLLCHIKGFGNVPVHFDGVLSFMESLWHGQDEVSEWKTVSKERQKVSNGLCRSVLTKIEVFVFVRVCEREKNFCKGNDKEGSLF